mgnify:CR=1 FL=1
MVRKDIIVGLLERKSSTYVQWNIIQPLKRFNAILIKVPMTFFAEIEKRGGT